MKRKAPFAEAQRRNKRLLSSLAYAALVGIVAALGYLTLQILESSPHDEEVSPPPDPAALIEFDGFSARFESSNEQRRLRLSVRLRAAAARPLDCQVFFVAKGGRTNGQQFGVWPTFGPGGPFSSAGYFRGGAVSQGAALRLTQTWQRITGEIPLPSTGETFYTVTLYVFGPRGEVLLSRPFDLGSSGR
ncbi:hypothetical protein HRbin30_02683 [bacterium HR30]|nr:hypothetical protein HRbin30_02683 [bacterium HR30]